MTGRRERLRAQLCRVSLAMLLPLATLPATARAEPAADPPAARGELDCNRLLEVCRLGGALPRVAARLVAGQPLTIVAIGSSSTAGAGASSPGNAYPQRLADELAMQFPDALIRVVNRGINGEEAAQMLARFDRDVFAEAPDLVIWQLGTNALLRAADLASFEAQVDAGLERLRAADVDVVLMDPQYAPAVLSSPGYRPMLERLDALAARHAVPVFRRFALMREWAKQLDLRYGSMLAGDGLHLNDASYRCLASQLARAIVLAAHRPAALATASPAGRRAPLAR